MDAILRFLKDQETSMLAELEQIVRVDSPSDNKSLVDTCGRRLQTIVETQWGVRGQVIEQSVVGNHLRFEYGHPGGDQVLLLTHYDTVWEPGRLSWRLEENRAYGPGVFDMKGGIIQGVWAVAALRHCGFSGRVVMLSTSDEEIGSVTSRRLIEEEARRSKAVFVLEPSVAGTGALKTSRKGVGLFQLGVEGRAAHAGNHPEAGISAIEELSHQVIRLHQMTDFSVGTTVNVGVIRGGSRSNVVADQASASIDVRVSSSAETKRIEAALKSLAPVLEGTTLTVTGGINRPPMERTNTTADLFDLASRIAESLGFHVSEASVGGGSDGNFTSVLGIPTLDGLGCVGDGPHAEYEHILVDEMPLRAALLAHLIQKTLG
jgi:glutamate carboxypeptidase